MRKTIAAGLISVMLAAGSVFGNLEDRVFNAIKSSVLHTLSSKPVPIDNKEIVSVIGANKPFLVIDKPEYKLYVISYDCIYQPCEWVYRERYDIALGRRFGDKKKEGDRKTPEGIYKVIKIEDQFGGPAFRINYPHREDKLEGKTGSGILIHITPENKIGKRISRGCIGLVKEDIYDLKEYIFVGTKVIIMPD